MTEKPINTLAWFSAFIFGLIQGTFLENWTEGIFFLVAAIFIYQLGTD